MIQPLESSPSKPTKMDPKTLQSEIDSLVPSLIEESSSSSTSTHIFLDEEESANSVGRRSSSPWTYSANNRTACASLQTKTRAPASDNRSLFSPTVPHETGNAAHLFLSYAGKPNTTSTMKTIHPTSTSSPRAPEHQRLSSWECSLDDFELECNLFLQSSQKLSQHRASSISKALKEVAKETSENDSLLGHWERRNARFVSYFRAALLRGGRKENDEMPTNPFDDNCDRTKDEEKPRREELERMREEIRFLRSTVKALVHSQNSGRQEQIPCPGGFKKNKAALLNDTKVETLAETMPLIPAIIHIRRIVPVIDDLTDCHLTEGHDASSDVTPCVGGTDSSDHEEVQGCIGFPNTAHSTPWQHSSSMGIVDFEIAPTRITKLEFPPTRGPTIASPGVVPCNLHRADKVSFPEMAKGEVQDKRARGMLCNIFFPTWGVLLQGKYSGTLRNLQPNGNGVLRFHNRDYYIGSFKDGMLHGEGALFLHRNGRLLKFRGQFDRNEYVGWTALPKDNDVATLRQSLRAE